MGKLTTSWPRRFQRTVGTATPIRPKQMAERAGLNAARMVRPRLESRRRTSPGLLIVVIGMFLACIGLTLAVGLMLEGRIAAVEAVVGLPEE